ncbi:MAG: tRNA (adenosine(37)-N6)-threonylcarbamoyltransferase complex dimerization subunit type 1 TsaB [Terricaulis sp.]
MIVLAIDTALDACSVAVVREDETLAALSESMQRGQAERLAPMVRDAVQSAGIAFAQLNRIAITTGPGSFTGVRVGLSFARALALALNKPCIGVSTLETLALEEGEQGLRAALIETIGASYAALYENGAPLLAPRAVERGEADALLREAAGGRAFITKGPSVTPNIEAFARRAAKLDPALYPPTPLYLRSHGAKLPGGVAP